jgi:hypothetical protein
MKKLLRCLFPALLLSFSSRSLLYAQAPDNPPVQTSPGTGQAPEEVMKRLAELVHSGKFAEAQQLTTGLLMAYPDDPRLIKVKALLDRSPASTSSPKTTNSNTPNDSPSAQPPARANPEKLTGMDKVDYSALIELARQAQQTTDLPEQSKLLGQFMDQSALFLQKHPEQTLLWQLRAASAISLNSPLAGFDAGQKLLAAGAADSADPNVLQLLAKLKLLGWMDRQRAEELQVSADNELKRQAEAAKAERLKAEHDKYTFPVAHAHGFSYSFGHLTFNENDGAYDAPDESIHFLKNDIREMQVLCLAKNMCGFYFYPKDGRRFFLIAVTEYAVANKTLKGEVFFPPSVLGNAAVERWKFVSIDKKTLGPPKAAANAPPANTPAVQPVALSVNAPAPAKEQPSVQQTPNQPANFAVLHVYRPHRLIAAVQKPDIFVDGKKIASIANSQSVRIVVPPGKHNISVSKSHLENEAPINDLEMVAGNEYWIRVDISNGAWTAHLKLSIIPTDQAQTESARISELRAGDIHSE